MMAAAAVSDLIPIRREAVFDESVMPKSRRGFLGDIMLYLIGTDHDASRSVSSRDIVI